MKDQNELKPFKSNLPLFASAITVPIITSALVALRIMVLPATVTCLGVSSLCTIEFDIAAIPSLNYGFLTLLESIEVFDVMYLRGLEPVNELCLCLTGFLPERFGDR